MSTRKVFHSLDDPGLFRECVSDSYAEGVAFQSPGSPAGRGAPWDRVVFHAKTPTGFYNRLSHRALMINRAAIAFVQPRWGNWDNGILFRYPGYALRHDPGLWNLTPSA